MPRKSYGLIAHGSLRKCEIPWSATVPVRTHNGMSTESDRIYHQKPPERHGLWRTGTVWYGATRIRTDALRIHYGLLRYKHGLVRIFSTVWYGEERIDTEKNELPRIYTDLIHPSTPSCLLIFKMPQKKRTPRKRIAEFNDFGGEDSA
jgi:hypothetical protein